MSDIFDNPRFRKDNDVSIEEQRMGCILLGGDVLCAFVLDAIDEFRFDLPGGDSECDFLSYTILLGFGEIFLRILGRSREVEERW